MRKYYFFGLMMFRILQNKIDNFANCQRLDYVGPAGVVPIILTFPHFYVGFGRMPSPLAFRERMEHGLPLYRLHDNRGLYHYLSGVWFAIRRPDPVGQGRQTVICSVGRSGNPVFGLAGIGKCDVLSHYFRLYYQPQEQ
jgi:hypothetical protein